MADGQKYVVHGMRAKCSEGSMENYINTDVGHGIVYQGQPVLNANDHEKNVNLTHFGDCNSKLIYEEAKKQADEKYKTEEGDGFFSKIGKAVAKTVTKAVLDVKAVFASNKCELDTPLPWIFASRDHMIDGAPALTMESQCACKFGGIITIVPEAEEASEEESEQEEEVVEIEPNAVPLVAAASETAETGMKTKAEMAEGVTAGVAAALAGMAIAAKNKEVKENGAIKGDQLKAFGWENTSEKEVAALNTALDKYGITSEDSRMLFLATCGHESGKGLNSLEKLEINGTTVGRYEKNERGAGYIQITWKDMHKKFLKTVNDSFDGEDTATYISENYPWEAAGWFWSSTEAKNTAVGSLNDYTMKYGSSKGVFLITQYLVNGWPSGLTNKDATSIRDGKVSWKIKNEKLYVNNKVICDAPIGWDDREKNYNDAINCFK